MKVIFIINRWIIITLRQYLIKIEKELFEIIISKKTKHIEIEYIINIEENKNFDVEYIENIYNDYRRLYKFNYNYDKYKIENVMKYIFKIIFI